MVSKTWRQNQVVFLMGEDIIDNEFKSSNKDSCLKDETYLF